jgi:hypothetical protein
LNCRLGTALFPIIYFASVLLNDSSLWHHKGGAFKRYLVVQAAFILLYFGASKE